MRLFTVPLVILGGMIGMAASVVIAQGTVTIPFANVTTSCLNVKQKTVDFWILSARVPTDATWITSTNGIGARVDVQMSGPGQKASFPAAAAISTKDMSGQIVRASLSLHVLADQDLWNDGDSSSPSETTDLAVPVTFVRLQGASDTVKVMQALINFTNTSTGTIPPNPYVKGAELVGQLTNCSAPL